MCIDDIRETEFDLFIFIGFNTVYEHVHCINIQWMNMYREGDDEIVMAGGHFGDYDGICLVMRWWRGHVLVCWIG